jgi:hypothetical protein
MATGQAPWDLGMGYNEARPNRRPYLSLSEPCVSAVNKSDIPSSTRDAESTEVKG